MPDKKRPKLVVLAGPTAVGKTGLSLALAKRMAVEIVNSDSLQVYRYLDIGTAKPTREEQNLVPHHLIDVVDPDQDFDAAQYLNLARPIIEDINFRHKLTLVVGGTGLYLRSLLKGLFAGPGQSQAIRQRIKDEAKKLGRQAMHDRLAAVDPESAAHIHPNDLVRLERALEVFELTGQPISRFKAEHGLAENPFNVLFYCLNIDRDELYARIEARTIKIFEQGLIQEVEGLLARGYSPDLKPLKSIGYAQAIRHLKGKSTLDQAITDTATQTRRLAKRQLTWYRAQPEARWRSPEEEGPIVEEVSRFWETGD